MSLYGEYIKEVIGWEIIEDSTSFVTYQKLQNEIRIIDMYIKPEWRKSGKWKEMFDKVENIGKLFDKSSISVVINMDIPKEYQNRTKHMCHKVGMKIEYQDEFFIIYKRGLK